MNYTEAEVNMFDITTYLEQLNTQIKEIEEQIKLLSTIAATRNNIINSVKTIINRTESNYGGFSIDPNVVAYLQKKLAEVQNVDTQKNKLDSLIQQLNGMCLVQDRLTETIDNYKTLNKLLEELNSPNS